jgi:hypothetical protein
VLYVNKATGEIIEGVAPPGFAPVDHLEPLVRSLVMRQWRTERRLAKLEERLLNA